MRAEKHVFGDSQTLALCVGNHDIGERRLTHNGQAIKLVNVAERLEAVTIKALLF
jgi:hypothetical protein